MSLSKTTLVFVVCGITLAAAIAPLFMNQASAKITEEVIEESCENPGGNEAGGQQPQCKGEGQTQITVTENQNPAGSPPPGQNK